MNAQIVSSRHVADSRGLGRGHRPAKGLPAGVTRSPRPGQGLNGGVQVVAAVLALCASAAVPAQVFPMPAASDERIQRVDPPAGPGAMAPNLTRAGDDVLLSWIEPVLAEQVEAGESDSPRLAQLRFARFSSGEWSEPRTIIERDDLFVNWADLPHVRQAHDGSLLAHWLRSSGEAWYAYDVMLARSTDDGKSWTDLGPAHDDGTKTEHGFVSSVVEEGGVRLFWLDGRETESAAADTHDPHDPHDPHGHGGGDMQLRTALVTDRVHESTVLDPRVCECCNTSAALTESGPVIVYRDRTHDEVRDISIVRMVDGEWTTPRTVHDDGWGVSGCPVNGPAIDARGNNLVVAWPTGAEFKPRVLVAFSDDGGATFTEPIQLDGEPSMGRVDIVMNDDGSAVVSWLTTDGYGGIIRLQRVEADGTLRDAIDAARTSPSRHSGFPKIERVGDQVIAVWTHIGEPFKLRAALVDVP